MIFSSRSRILIMRIYIIAFVVIISGFASVEGQSLDKANRVLIESIELPNEIARVLRDYEKGWRARDADYLASLFAEDAFIMRPGHAPVRGRQQIAESYKGSGGPLFLRAFEYSISDSIGYIIGGFSAAEASPDIGKYILTLRKVENKWFITADMDNGNRR